MHLGRFLLLLLFVLFCFVLNKRNGTWIWNSFHWYEGSSAQILCSTQEIASPGQSQCHGNVAVWSVICLLTKGPRSKRPSAIERETAFLEMPKWFSKDTWLSQGVGWLLLEMTFWWIPHPSDTLSHSCQSGEIVHVMPHRPWWHSQTEENISFGILLESTQEPNLEEGEVKPLWVWAQVLLGVCRSMFPTPPPSVVETCMGAGQPFRGGGASLCPR